jgi:hypothetical protein
MLTRLLIGWKKLFMTLTGKLFVLEASGDGRLFSIIPLGVAGRLRAIATLCYRNR